MRLIYRPIVRWLSHQRKISDIPLCDFDRILDELQPGDVLLVEGRTRVSDVIKAMTQSPWSHAALFVGRLNDIKDTELRSKAIAHTKSEDANAMLIVESELGMGTVLRSVEAYRGDHIRICRPKDITQGDVTQIIRYCFSKLGTPYDVRQILDLLRWLLPWRFFPRKWRSSLFESTNQNTRTICSSMIAEAFMDVEFPVLPLVQRDDDDGFQLYKRNPKLFVPRDFDYSPYFEIIKYPFIDYKNKGDYKLLPWQGKIDGHHSPDEAYSGMGLYHRYPNNYELRILLRPKQKPDYSAVFQDLDWAQNLQ